MYAAQSSKNMCRWCETNEGVFYCYECKQALCRGCNVTHGKVPALKDHFVTDLKRVDLSTFKSVSDCQYHDQPYSLYCRGCTSLICKKCVTTVHKGHEFSEIETIVLEQKKSAEKQTAKMKVQLQKSTKMIERIKSVHLKDLDNETQNAKYRINEFAAGIQKVVNSQKDIKVTEIDDFKSLEREELQMALLNKERAHRQRSNMYNRLEKMLAEKHDVTFLIEYKNVEKEFEYFDDDFTMEDIKPKHLQKISRQTFISEIINALKLQYEISGPDIDNKSEEEREMTNVVPKIENIHEHLMSAHLHGRHEYGYDHGFPHPEGPQSDDEKDEDDSKNKILHLLWTHQEFFDPKALSKAQAEYNYYRQIEKQWRRTFRRVKMDDIKYQKFEIKLFTDFPRNRPLYAVIKTLLTQSKDRKMVDAAIATAGDYYKLTVLEQTMITKGIITNIPQGIEMDDASYSELCNEMKSRFKGKNLRLREASEFKMVTLWEYLKLKETIRAQTNQIEDLASRLSGIASHQLADGDPGFRDLVDKNRPQKLGERFAELFEETWPYAYEALKPKNQDADDDESDEPTMDKLQQVVRVIYEYCKKVADEQIGQIVTAMIPPVLDPVTNNAEKHKNATKQMRAKTQQMAREYRKVVAAATVKVLQKEIMEKEIKDKLLKEPFGKELQTYVDECIDLIWYMCIQQPQMEIMWAKEGEKFNREHFRFSERKGKKYKLTVWPALFLHKDGPLVAPGYAVPSK